MIVRVSLTAIAAAAAIAGFAACDLDRCDSDRECAVGYTCDEKLHACLPDGSQRTSGRISPVPERASSAPVERPKAARPAKEPIAAREVEPNTEIELPDATPPPVLNTPPPYFDPNLGSVVVTIATDPGIVRETPPGIAVDHAPGAASEAGGGSEARARVP